MSAALGAQPPKSVAEVLEGMAEEIHNKPWEHIDNRSMAERLRNVAAYIRTPPNPPAAAPLEKGARPPNWMGITSQPSPRFSAEERGALRYMVRMLEDSLADQSELAVVRRMLDTQ